jgi:membrane fusion protein (multidrug efflux system)
VRLHGFERDSALAVPRRAVQQSLDQQFVLLVGKGDTVAAKDVETGSWSGDWWIIERGLKSGDRVVVDGVQKAAPGSPVRPVAIEDSAAAGADSAAAGPDSAAADSAGGDSE